MTSIFDENVALDATTTGRHALFEQWRLYSELFRMTTYRADAVSAHVLSDGDDDAYVVEAYGAFNGRMTYDALANVFPHVLDDHELVAKLIGVRCDVRCVRACTSTYPAASPSTWWMQTC
jgi:hypothetical protein